MHCAGCQRVVNACLTKTAGSSPVLPSLLALPLVIMISIGVQKVDIDLEKKRVVVEGTATDATVEAALVKAGKPFKRLES